jgi:hypothetical protein
MRCIITFTLLLVFGTISYVSVLALSEFLSTGALGYFIGAGLEMGKFTSIIYIHRNWHKPRKYFYIPIVVLIASLTTAEVIGYLSYNHINSTLDSKSSEKKLISLDKEKMFLTKQIELVEKNLSELPVGFVKRKEDARNKKEYKDKISRITSIMQKERELFSDMKTVIAGGPVYATAEIMGIQPENISRFFIILLVLVWELLSTYMIVAFSAVWEPAKKEPEINKLPEKNPTRNEILIRLKEEKGLTSGQIAQITDRKQIKTVEAWIKNESEIPIKALEQIMKVVNSNKEGK